VEQLDWDRAAMIEPVACCLHGLKSANIHAKDTVLVLGSGTIGLVSAQLAALKASTVIVSDLSRFKRELALKIGVTHAIDPANEDLETRVAEITDGKGPDVVIIAAGVSSLVSQAVNVVRREVGSLYSRHLIKTRWWKLMPDACSGMKYPSLVHTPSPLTT
jgi:L-iditol 2-dehydrogenase